MIMDNAEINIGDSVHDIVFGTGIIKRLVPEENKFWVSFGPNSLRSFNTAGFGNFTERTLYWRNPVLMAPRKDGNSWDQIIKITNAVSQALGIM